jgi:hypothetical protein
MSRPPSRTLPDPRGRASSREPPPVDRQHGPGDVRRVVREQRRRDDDAQLDQRIAEPRPATRSKVLDALDEQVVAAGGRVYLAKDSRLSAATFRRMYPRLGEFLAMRRKVDPNGIFNSDLARRLELV